MLTGTLRTGLGLALAGGLILGAGFGPGVRDASAQGQWTGTSSPDDLRYRLDILDAELQDIRARLGASGEIAPRTGGVSGGDVGQLEAEIQRLTARVEEMQNLVDRLNAQSARRFSDIEFRLTELEGGDISTVQPVEPVAPAGQDVTPPPGQPAQPGQPDQQVAVADVSISEQGDLDRAIQDVEQGRFDQAEDRLRRFINDYPQSPLVGDAWYWLGESQFVRGIQDEAARSYLNGYNADQSGPRAAHNLFRLGVTLGRLGQLDVACQTLRQVRRQFPGAPDNIVSRADEEADRLTCG